MKWNEHCQRLLAASYTDVGLTLREENPRKYGDDYLLRRSFATRPVLRRVCRKFSQDLKKYCGPTHEFFLKTGDERLNAVKCMVAHFPDVQPNCPTSSSDKYQEDYFMLLKQQGCPFL